MSPLLLPKTRGIRHEANYSGRPAATWGTALTSGAVAHTLPAAYTDLIAATAFDTDWVELVFHTNNGSNTDTDSLVNIYIGAGGSEQILIPNLLAGWATTPTGTQPGKEYRFPLRIPAGSRLSARHQSVRTGTDVRCMVDLFGGGDHWVGTKVEAVGANAATSGGTFVTPGGVSEGTLTSIGTNTLDWGYVVPMIGGNTDTTLNSGWETADIGSGAATLIPGLEDFLFETSTIEAAWSRSHGRFCHVPASTTLYLRTQFSGTTEAKDYIIYGVA